MIKFTTLYRAYTELQEELRDAYNEIHLSGQVTNGKYCKLVEEDLKRITQRKFAKMFPSGTSAILGALLAWNIKNKKVACTNYSYVASTNQAALLNDVELFDVDKNGLMLLKEQINHDACMPVSLYGNTVDYDEFYKNISPNTKIIVDCAQSLGAKYKNKPDGSFGDVAVFSFSTNKPVPTAGTHGALVWDDENMTDIINQVANNGKLGRNDPINYLGINGTAYELQACQIYFGLKRLEKWQTRREKISKYYINAFTDLPLSYIVPNEHCASNFHKFVIQHQERDAIHNHLRANNIDAQKHYTDNFNDFFGNKKEMPNTTMLCNSVLSIPNNQWLTDAEVETVAETLKKFF
jgi:dTDP-4-amino-4,6-dideoxygalactose transaminase